MALIDTCDPDDCTGCICHLNPPCNHCTTHVVDISRLTVKRDRTGTALASDYPWLVLCPEHGNVDGWAGHEDAMNYALEHAREEHV